MKHIKNKRLINGMLALALVYVTGATAADYPGEGDFLNGSKVWSNNCNRCHNMRGPTELRDDQWITTSFHMRVRAGLTGEETRDVITFLQTANNQ